MSTQTLQPTRETLQIGVLAGLTVVLATQDLPGVTPWILVGIAFLIARNVYRRTRQEQPWECNDEP